jgi:hypothetical protein
MPTANEPDKNDYFIDAESSTEMARLIEQDRYITNAMPTTCAMR